MIVVEATRTVDDDGLAAHVAPRVDLVREGAPRGTIEDGVGQLTYGQDEGPCTSYERVLVVQPDPGGGHRVTQTTRYTIRIAAWILLMRFPINHALRRPGRPRPPWWAPPQVLDAGGATALATMAFLSLIAGYTGTLITQTLTFAASDFGVGDRAQGDTLAGVRIGVLVALAVAAWADRHGRRRAVLWCAGVGVAVTALGAIAPNLWVLGATQVVARGLSTALALLIVVVAAEEMPAGSRAWGVSLLTMSAALGAGQVLWLLPVCDLGEGAWRILYVVPLLYLPLVRAIAPIVPESRRFSRTHAQARFSGHGRRLALLASTSLLLACFSSPASQLQNEFLRDEFGYSAAAITAFTLLTVTPGSIGIVLGGRMADARGKRLVGGIGIAGGTALTVGQYLTSSDAVLWACSAAGSVLGGLAVPALSVYGPELFPTALRTKANVVITTIGVGGSVAGLVIAGRLAERWSLGPGISALAVGPALVCLALIPLYPETASRELEDLNPEDALAATPIVPG